MNQIDGIIDRLRSTIADDELQSLDFEIGRLEEGLHTLRTLKRLIVRPDEARPPEIPDTTPAAPAEKPRVCGVQKKSAHGKTKGGGRPSKQDNERLTELIGSRLKSQGPMARSGLRDTFGIGYDRLDSILAHTWFEKDGTKFTLSSDGHVHFANREGNADE
jgi:hypothetical protein